MAKYEVYSWTVDPFRHKLGEFDTLEDARLAVSPSDTGVLYIWDDQGELVRHAQSYQTSIEIPDTHQLIQEIGWEFLDGTRKYVAARHAIWDKTKANPYSGGVVGSGAWSFQFTTGSTFRKDGDGTIFWAIPPSDGPF